LVLDAIIPPVAQVCATGGIIGKIILNQLNLKQKSMERIPNI
jgi:hypothetical protein